jgi:hypothetical protein
MRPRSCLRREEYGAGTLRVVNGEQVGDGLWMAVSDRAVELFVPRLFGDRPISFSPAELGVGRVGEVHEPAAIPGMPPLSIVLLSTARKEPNILLVRAQPGLFPPVRRRARFTPEGFLFRRGRERSHDGYDFHAKEPDRVIDLLTRHGVEPTRTPAAWAAARRGISA